MKENLNDKLADALNDVDDGYIEKTADPPKKKRNLWIRVTAIAACLALVAAAIPLWALLRGKPGVTTDHPSTTADPFVDPPPSDDAPSFGAADLAGLFGEYDGDTQYYEEVWAMDPFYPMYAPEIPEAEYLPVYGEYAFRPDRESFQSFIGEHLPSIAEAMGLDDPTYEIKGSDYSDMLEADVNNSASSGSRMVFLQSGWYNAFTVYGRGEKIALNGKTARADQWTSDERIIESLSDYREELEKVFGRQFPDAKVLRHYSNSGGVVYMLVYFYDASDPMNTVSEMPRSDHVRLWFGGKDGKDGDWILDATDIHYYALRADHSETFKVLSNEKMISLEKAEEMLNAGYVFGGHICRICAGFNKPVDFSDYDLVGLTYVFGGGYSDETVSNIGIPFYIFYKRIGAPGTQTRYARTYVPAIEVSGLKEYFAAQESVHKTDPWWKEDYPDDE